MNIDFENKKIAGPFITPPGFHEELRERLMSIPCTKRRKRHSRNIVMLAIASAAAVMAIIVTMPEFSVTHDQPSSIDNYLTSLSDSELEYQISLSENDLFLDL